MLKCIKIVCACAALLGVCGVALQLVRGSWQGVVYFYPEGGGLRQGVRELAQVDKKYDFSEKTLMASQQRLVKSLKWHRHEDLLGVELGHFVVKTGLQTKNFACNVYPGVELEFVSDGVAVHGQPSRMLVQGPCRARDDDNSRMQVLWLPVHRAFRQKPQDVANLSLNVSEGQALVAAGYTAPESGTRRIASTEPQDKEALLARVSFQNIGDVWPKKWVLKKVSLTKGRAVGGDNKVQRDTASFNEPSLSVNAPEVRRILGGKNLILDL